MSTVGAIPTQLMSTDDTTEYSMPLDELQSLIGETALPMWDDLTVVEDVVVVDS